MRAAETCRDLPTSPAKLAALVKAEVAASMNGPAVATRLREQASDPLGAALALTLGGLGGLAQWLHDGGAAASWWTALATCLAAYAVRLILATSGWELARPVRSHP